MLCTQYVNYSQHTLYKFSYDALFQRQFNDTNAKCLLTLTNHFMVISTVTIYSYKELGSGKLGT